MERAGFWSRLFAFFLDALIITLPLNILWSIYQEEWTNTLTQGWGWDIVYAAYMTIVPVLWGGYIIGKRLVTIKGRKIGDEPVTLLQMFVREVVGKLIFGYLTLGVSVVVSVFMIIFRKDKRAIHDLMAQTYVKNIV